MSMVSHVLKGLLSVYLLFWNYVYTYIVNVFITIRMLFFANPSNIKEKKNAFVLYEKMCCIHNIHFFWSL